MAQDSIGRNQVFPIYNADETPFHGLVLHKSTVESIIMSLGDKISGDVYYANNSLQVTMQEYIVYNNVRYILVNPPTIIREGMVVDNGDLRGMTKYSFEFYHPMYVLGNFPFSDVAVSQDEKRYLSENKSFSWIGKPQDFIDKINKNLEGTEWIVVKSENFPEDTEDELSDVLTFDNNTIADALKIGYETWGLPYIVDKIREDEQGFSSEKKFKVIFGLPSNVIKDGQNEYVFRMGQGVGLKNNSRTPRNNKIVTRIAGYGSENNIPYGYPQIQWYGESNAKFTYGDHAGVYDNVTIGGRTFAKFVSYPIYDGIVGGQNVKLIKHPFTRNHLMPSVYRQNLFNKVSPYLSDGSTNSNYDPDIELVDYYDANTDSYPNQINLSSPSYEIHQFEDIKPELGEAEIVGVQPINNDGTDADGWDDTMDDDGNYLQSYFKLTLQQLDFDLYACAAITEEMQINMRSGACIGCTFPVQVDWDDYKKNFYDDDGNFDPVIGDGHPRNASKYPNSSSGNITIIVQKEYSTFGVLMPNIYQKPVSGDEFVILGISLPDTYVTNAEGRLDEEMRAYMLANNIYYYDYPLKFDEYFLATHTNILSQIRTNTQVKFQFANEDPMTLFVKQIVIKYGDNVLPQYNITLTDSIEVVLNQIGKVADDVEKLSTLVSVLRQSYNRNVWGEIAKKLSKTSNDTAQGEITFLQGLKIGSNGNNGITPNGDATLNDVNVSGNLTITHVETPQGGEPVIKEYGITNDGDISGEGLEIGNFANSGLLGTGGAFKMIDGKSYLEADKLYVRMKAYFDTLEIRRYIHSGGNRVASAAGCKVSRVVGSSGGSFYRLCFKATDGDNTVTNDFTVGDFAYCHTTNLEGGELNQQNYWRLVMRYGSLNASRQIVSLNGEPVSGVEDTVVTEHFIDVANTTNAVDIGEEENYQGMMAGSTEPKAEDDVVQLGHAFDEDRQGAIIEAVTGAAQAPTYRIYQGIDSFNLENKCKVDMGYDLVTHRAYLNVSGDFHFGDNDSYVKFNSGTGVLDIKAKIDASSPVGNGGLTLYGYVNDIAGTAASTAENNAKNYADEKVGDYEYLKNALEDGETVIDGGLILTYLIALKNSGGNVTAGITGLSDANNNIALWLGGLMADWESLTPEQQAVANRNNYAKSLFRFDGSGYLAGGDISWQDNGDTTVKGTIKADNLYHGVCHFYKQDGSAAVYVNNDEELYYYIQRSTHRRDEGEPYERFVNGHYYTSKQIKELSNNRLSKDSDGFIANTGNADVVMCMPDANNWNVDNDYVNLPDPEQFPGKIVEISAFSYGTESSTLAIRCVRSDYNNDNRIVGLVRIDSSGNIINAVPVVEKAWISTGGVARFVSVEALISGTTKWVWVLLANQTGGDVYIGGGQGSGTVTSVGLVMPSGTFNVSNTPITSNGNLTVSFANQNANLVFASPNGSTGTPSWRSLVADDIPSLAASKITSGTFDAARIPNLSWNKITSNKPTTIAGYGITDAYISGDTIYIGSNSITPLTQHQSLSGYATQQWCYSNLQPKMNAYNTVNGSSLGWFGDIVAAGATVGGGKLILNFLPLSGGALTDDLSVDGNLSVTGTVEADSFITSDLKILATEDWVEEQGYQTAAIETVYCYGNALTVTNKSVSIPLAGTNTPGVIQVGDGLTNNEDHLEVDTSIIASKDWVNKGYSNGRTTKYVEFPDYSWFNSNNYYSGYGGEDYFKALLKWCVAQIPTWRQNGEISASELNNASLCLTLIGSARPNGSGTAIINLYAASGAWSGEDDMDGMPKYASGVYFAPGTSEFVWHFRSWTVQANSAPVWYFSTFDFSSIDADRLDGHHASDFLLLSGGGLTGNLAITDAELKVSNGNGGWVHQKVHTASGASESTYKFYTSQNAQNSTPVTGYEFDKDVKVKKLIADEVQADNINAGLDIIIDDASVSGKTGRFYVDNGSLYYQYDNGTPVRIV